MDSGNGCFYPLISWLFLSAAEWSVQPAANTLPDPFGRNRRIHLEMHLILIDYLIIATSLPASQFF